MPSNTECKTIIQIAIVCRDVDATAKRWAALLGVDPPKSFSTDPGLACNMTYRGKPSNAQCKLAFLETGACQLELIQPLGPGSSWQEHLDQNGESIHHIAFKVKDINGSLQACEKMGISCIKAVSATTKAATLTSTANPNSAQSSNCYTGTRIKNEPKQTRSRFRTR